MKTQKKSTELMEGTEDPARYDATTETTPQVTPPQVIGGSENEENEEVVILKTARVKGSKVQKIDTLSELLKQLCKGIIDKPTLLSYCEPAVITAYNTLCVADKNPARIIIRKVNGEKTILCDPVFNSEGQVISYLNLSQFSKLSEIEKDYHGLFKTERKKVPLSLFDATQANLVENQINNAYKFCLENNIKTLEFETGQEGKLDKDMKIKGLSFYDYVLRFCPKPEKLTKWETENNEPHLDAINSEKTQDRRQALRERGICYFGFRLNGSFPEPFGNKWQKSNSPELNSTLNAWLKLAKVSFKSKAWRSPDNRPRGTVIIEFFTPEEIKQHEADPNWRNEVKILSPIPPIGKHKPKENK
jgi:hypothetical protein